MNRRVHYFSPSDMSSYYNLQKAAQVIESFSEEKVYTDINEVIELYHILLHYQNQVQHSLLQLMLKTMEQLMLL